MDIFINGKQGAGKTSAARAILGMYRPAYKLKLSDRDVMHVYERPQSVADLVYGIRQRNPRAVIFDGSITSGADLLIAVQAIKEYRVKINADVLAIYIQQAEVIAVRDVLDADIVEPTYNGEFRKVSINPLEVRDHVNHLYEESTHAAMKPEYASAERIPLTFDEGTKDFTAANLMQGDRILVQAVNVYAFNGALKLGDGKRAKRFMLFELAEVVPVSNLHVAVDKMNTHYFQHGTFEKRAFQAVHCRPATPAEVLEYLNAKLKYEADKN